MTQLPDEERARHDRFHFDRDRREYALAHALLRATLSELGGLDPAAWRCEPGPHASRRWRRPLALAGGLQPLARARPRRLRRRALRGQQPRRVRVPGVLEVDVCLDVERITRAADWRGIAERHFSHAELAQINRKADGERATRFFELWTLKEAFSRALGLGLAQALDAPTFELAHPAVYRRHAPARDLSPATWQFALFAPSPERQLAVAVRDNGPARRWQICAGPCDGAGVLLAPTRTSLG